MVTGMEAPASQRHLTLVGDFTPRSLRRPSILRVGGALDAFTVREQAPRFEDAAAGNPRQLVVDFADLDLLDSAGVHALVTLYKRVTAQGGKMVVVHAHDQPLKVLEILKLTAVFGL